MSRYFKLFAIFVRTCMVKELEFRGNFWMGIVTNIAWVSANLIFMKIIYANVQSVGGWTQGQGIMLLGTYTLTRGLVDVFFARNLAELPNQVRLGTFDFTLLRPVNSQFFVSMRYLNFGEVGSVIAATAMVAYGASLAHLRVTAAGLAGYAVMVVCGLCIFYCVYMMLMSTAFWFVKVDNLWTLGETVFQVARVPINIFGPVAARVFTFVLPLIFIAHVPAEALQRLARPLTFGVGIGMALVLALVSARFWNFATQFYSSASS